MIETIIRLYADSAKREILKIYAGSRWDTITRKALVGNFSGETLFQSQIRMIPVAIDLI